MKLVVGLGNPGRRYADTRHNVGFLVVERFAVRHRIALDAACFEGRFGRGRVADLDVGVLQPLTYMNLSGEALAQALASLPVADPARDLVVVLDDVDLPFGRLRLRAAGGDGGHQGLRDVIDRLGRQDFARLRFGIGRGPAGTDATHHVLARFSPEEREELAPHLERAADALDTCLLHGAPAAMNRFNAAPPEA